MVRNQIGNLIPTLSFGHNLCFKCSNESCEPILDIYVSIAFQWYEELFNPMGFDSCNRSLKAQESIESPTPKMTVHLGMWGFILSHFPAVPGVQDVSPELPSCPAVLQAFALVASPRLRLRHVHTYCPLFAMGWNHLNNCF